MHIRSAFPLALSATILACILEKADDVTFWEKNEHIAALFGVSLVSTFCVGGWMFMSKDEEGGHWRMFAAFPSCLIAIMSLAAFFSTISKTLGVSFAIGQVVVSLMVLLGERAERQDRETKKKAQQISDLASPPSSNAANLPPAE